MYSIGGQNPQKFSPLKNLGYTVRILQYSKIVLVHIHMQLNIHTVSVYAIHMFIGLLMLITNSVAKQNRVESSFFL